MDKFLEKVTAVNGAVYDVVWGVAGLVLLLGSGILLTVLTRFFQVSHLRHWWKNTIGSLFRKGSSATKKDDQKSISQFQALCTALAATVGTGNIAGVASAIVLGGPGAVFWMWVAAFFGMMTKYSEIVLGIFFRRRNKDGEWSGGAMYYINDGLGKKRGFGIIAKILSVLFACFTILASFGIGNMGQVNKITGNIKSAFFSGVSLGKVGGIDVLSLIIGLALVVLGGIIIIGGLQRVAGFAEKVVPLMAALYIMGALVILFMNINSLGLMFSAIFKYAFTARAGFGGAVGSIIVAMTNGFKRGVFSNEAGLGSSAIVHASADVKEPVKQGMWGIFEVFFDTIIICTMTAIVVLSSGFIDLKTGVANVADDGTLVSQVFSASFGRPGAWFIAIAMLLFAFTTVLGWSQYGSKAVEYLFGTKGVKVYKVIFVLMIVSGAIMTNSLAWDLSDTFNGLMMVPNLIGMVALCPLIVKITRNYVKRKFRGEELTPMLSYDPAIQTEMAKKADD